MGSLVNLERPARGAGINAVFFDVGGTLIEPRYPVGEIYAKFAARFGRSADPVRLQANFLRHFPLQPKLAFRRDLPLSNIFSAESDWWRRLVSDVFVDEGPFPRFDEFFEAVYEAFRGDDLWTVLDGVVPTLETLRQRNLSLGVVSNFDSRLPTILRECELAHYFVTVRFSSLSNSAKPDSVIFQTALDELQLRPEETVHVGDSWNEDIEGALAMGMRAILFDPRRRFIDNPGLRNENVTRIERFDQLTEIDYLQGK